MRSMLVLALVSAACGKEIGDECVVSSDCSPNGDRQCDVSSRQGYCTIQGCDVDTCPEEATCVRFFTGNFANKTCVQATEDRPSAAAPTDDCSFDELCSLTGQCVPRSSEVRFCMRTCGNTDDCRGGYACRDIELMKRDGGEPVLQAGVLVDESAPKFCAAALN